MNLSKCNIFVKENSLDNWHGPTKLYYGSELNSRSVVYSYKTLYTMVLVPRIYVMGVDAAPETCKNLASGHSPTNVLYGSRLNSQYVVWRKKKYLDNKRNATNEYYQSRNVVCS